MQLLEYLYRGSTLWHKNRAKRTVSEDTSFITNPSPFKTIGLMFRTVKPDGVLVYAATNKHFTSVEVSNSFPDDIRKNPQIIKKKKSPSFFVSFQFTTRISCYSFATGNYFTRPFSDRQ